MFADKSNKRSKQPFEFRVEWLMWGVALLVFAIGYMVRETVPGLMWFGPGLVLLWGAFFQDLLPSDVGLSVGWPIYVLAVLMTGFGGGRLYNKLLFQNSANRLPWLIVSIGIGGVILIVKALWDMSVGRSRPGEQ
jgi:hypothetical protein